MNTFIKKLMKVKMPRILVQFQMCFFSDLQWNSIISPSVYINLIATITFNTYLTNFSHKNISKLFIFISSYVYKFFFPAKIRNINLIPNIHMLMWLLWHTGKVEPEYDQVRPGIRDPRIFNWDLGLGTLEVGR